MEHTRWYLWQLAARFRSKPRHATDLCSAAVWTKIPSIWGLWVVNSQIMKCFYCFIIFIIHQLRWWSLDLFAIDQTIWSNLVIQRSPGLFILLVCWPCQVWTDPVQCTSDQETTQEWGFCTLGPKRLTEGRIRKWFHGWLRSVTYHVTSHISDVMYDFSNVWHICAPEIWAVQATCFICISHAPALTLKSNLRYSLHIQCDTTNNALKKLFNILLQADVKCS